MALPISYTDQSKTDPFASASAAAYLDDSNWTIDFGTPAPSVFPAASVASPWLWVAVALGAAVVLVKVARK